VSGDIWARKSEASRQELEDALREEIPYLWNDLSFAMQDAMRNGWSMRCDWVCHRIKRISALVGLGDPAALPPSVAAAYEALAAGELPSPYADPELRTREEIQ
jgi:hypothetical protein